jgi:hypothetical protein
MRVDTTCYCPRCSSNSKESMVTESCICLREESGVFSARYDVTCQLHLAALPPHISTLSETICSSDIELIQHPVVEESSENEKKKRGEKSLG